jgi:hypothetical protein
MENMEGNSNEMPGLEERVREVLNLQAQTFQNAFDTMQGRLNAQEEELRNARLAGQQEVPTSTHENGTDQGFRGTTRRYVGKVAKPPTYNGRIRDPSTINTWVLRMDDYLDLTNCSEDSKSRVAATYLGDNAYIWYMSVVEARGTEMYYSWDEMKVQFRQYFLPPNADAMWFDKWDQVRQTSSVQ